MISDPVSDSVSPVRIYLAAALLGADDLSEACASYDRIARALRGSGMGVYVPHEHTHPRRTGSLRPHEVFERGLAAIRSCDVVVALLDEPSLGVGTEVVLAMQESKKVIGAYREGRSVSRFTLGLLEKAPDARVLPYHDPSEIAAGVVELLASWDGT